MVNWLTEDFGAAPQLMPDDIPPLVAEGVTTVICNRPDAEVPPDVSSEAMRAAVEAAGLTFVDNPYTAGMPSLEQIELQGSSTGKTVAYCASGTRSTILWMLSEAKERPVDEILDRAASAGYQLGGLRGAIESMSER